MLLYLYGNIGLRTDREVGVEGERVVSGIKRRARDLFKTKDLVKGDGSYVEGIGWGEVGEDIRS